MRFTALQNPTKIQEVVINRLPLKSSVTQIMWGRGKQTLEHSSFHLVFVMQWEHNYSHKKLLDRAKRQTLTHTRTSCFNKNCHNGDGLLCCSPQQQVVEDKWTRHSNGINLCKLQQPALTTIIHIYIVCIYVYMYNSYVCVCVCWACFLFSQCCKRT